MFSHSLKRTLGFPLLEELRNWIPDTKLFYTLKILSFRRSSPWLRSKGPALKVLKLVSLFISLLAYYMKLPGPASFFECFTRVENVKTTIPLVHGSKLK